MIGERIRLLRNSYHMSQVELAGALDVSKQTVSNWENNNIPPSIDTLMRTAGFFHVSTDYLLGLEENRTLDTAGLTDEQISHIQLIINDIVSK